MAEQLTIRNLTIVELILSYNTSETTEQYRINQN